MPGDRVMLLKPSYVLETLKDDDENVVASGLIDHYKSRPESLENITLAEYVAWYLVQTGKSGARRRPTKAKSCDSHLPKVQDVDDKEDLIPEEHDSDSDEMIAEITQNKDLKRCKVNYVYASILYSTVR